MFGRVICYKLPECIFENFEIGRVKREQFKNFPKSRGLFIPKVARTNMWVLVNHTNSTNILY